MEKIYIFIFLTNFAVNLIFPFISLYLYSLNLPEEKIGKLMSILNLSTAFGFIASLILSKYERISYLVFQISLFLYGISFLLLFYSKSFTFLVFSILFLSIIGGISFLLYNWFIISVLRKKSKFAFHELIYAISYIFSVIISGIIIKYFGFRYFLFLLPFFSLLFSLLILSQLKVKMRKERFEFSFSEKFKKFLISYSIFYFSLGIASPFFPIFLVKILNLSALEWSIVGIVEMISFILFFSSILEISKKYSSKSLLFFSTFLISTIPLFWVITKNYILILFYSIISGISWRIFSIGVYSFVSQSVKSKFEIGALSFIGSITLSLGTLFSSFLLSFCSLEVIFLISFIFRFFSSILFLTLKKEKISLKEFEEGFLTVFTILRELFFLFPLKFSLLYNRKNRTRKSL